MYDSYARTLGARARARGPTGVPRRTRARDPARTRSRDLAGTRSRDPARTRSFASSRAIAGFARSRGRTRWGASPLTLQPVLPRLPNNYHCLGYGTVIVSGPDRRIDQ